MTTPRIIAYMRTRLADVEAELGEDVDPNKPCCTVVGKGVVTALGVRGVRVAENADGTATYMLSVDQVRRALGKYQATLDEIARQQERALRLPGGVLREPVVTEGSFQASTEGTDG